MAASAPLRGSELIDCARANSSMGIDVAAERCGYGSDLARFQQELQQAGQSLGIDLQDFDDLKANSTNQGQDAGVVIAPDTQTQL
ncbi:hypothetical protein ACQ4M4_02455 [Leptolyngbya sp. AN02str]|uniref:hypothetical protein n=1 Tax=Leptolyngbya sp. AN02str TaxID=3423363 RepID=UPI003D3231C5